MITLYYGDALDIVPTLPAKSIDFIITDPPFGKLKLNCKWDKIIPYAPMWKVITHVKKVNCLIALFGNEPFSSNLRLSNEKDYRYDWIWKKPKGTGHLHARRMPMNDYETISIFYSERGAYYPQMTPGVPYKNKIGTKQEVSPCYGSVAKTKYINKGDRFPKRIIEFKVIERDRLHPTQKPTPLLEYFINTYTLPGEKVLDFTMGSGSTMEACKNTGRNGIGIDSSPLWYNVSVMRLREEDEQGIRKYIKDMREKYGKKADLDTPLKYPTTMRIK